MNLERLDEKKVVRYEVSKDGVGLLGFFEDGAYYHIHSDELSKLEKWILISLKFLELKVEEIRNIIHALPIMERLLPSEVLMIAAAIVEHLKGERSGI